MDKAVMSCDMDDSLFKLLCESVPQQLWTANAEGDLTYVNGRVLDYFQVPAEEILGQGWHEVIHSDDLPSVISKWTHALKTAQPYKVDFRLKGADGVYRWHIGQALPQLDDEGRVSQWFGSNTDITERKETEEALLTAGQLLDESQKIAKVGGWELDLVSGELFWTAETYRLHDTTPEEFNPTVDAGIEYYLPSSQEILTKALQAAINEGISYDLELETMTAKGRKIDVRTTCIVTVENGKTVKLTGIFQDITEQKNTQRELEAINSELARTNTALEHIAHFDALTNLPNRSLLADRMQQAMIHNQRHKRSMAVAFLDLDSFKEINDTYGHNVGDNLLIHITSKMKAALRADDTLARIGGDEFVAVLTDLRDASDCVPILENVLASALEPMEVDGNTVKVSTSIGVTIYPQDDADADQLLRHADHAMYLAKQAGKNCIHLFDVASDVAFQAQREELETIKQALENDEFVLFYQPKVNMQTGKVLGAEALIRWQHPEKGLLAPAAFLPAIEDLPISIALGEWVLSTALNQIESWRREGMEMPVSVNIGAYQLQQADFTDRLEQILKQFPAIKPHDLELEILETSALEDIPEVSKVIESCHKLGVDFALDDFGTGYSSLTYLKRLPAQLLKIDQTFVRDMLEDKDDLAIIRGIIGLAEAFNRKVIAEGVETIAHGEKLLSLGCHMAQGYGIARPMAAQEMMAWVETWKPNAKWLNKNASV